MLAQLTLSDIVNWAVVPVFGLIWWQMRETNRLDKELVKVIVMIESSLKQREEDRKVNSVEVFGLRAAIEKLTDKIDKLYDHTKGPHN